MLYWLAILPWGSPPVVWQGQRDPLEISTIVRCGNSDGMQPGNFRKGGEGIQAVLQRLLRSHFCPIIGLPPEVPPLDFPKLLVTEDGRVTPSTIATVAEHVFRDGDCLFKRSLAGTPTRH
jgi:hypothetical protein